jgi:hypothetical protein
MVIQEGDNMYRLIARLGIPLILAALFGAAVPVFIAAQELSEPEKNFEHLWKTYDRNYALYQTRRESSSTDNRRGS